MWIYQALLCILLSVDMECKKQTLQRYQKTENTRLLCTDCSESPRVKSLSLDDCARKCSKSKKSCRVFYFDQLNRKCHLLPFDRFSEGAQKERKPNYDLYEKKDYVKECIIGSGFNYKGRRSFTKTGITCQAWNMSVPHEHNFKPARHKRFDLRQNFCRNPDNDPSGPWCFTELTETRHQECGLPQCSDVECMRCNGETYRGPMDHTESGKACQRWDSQKPHKHTYQPHRHVDKGLDDNYCRNPNNDVRPWCYTMERNTPWEYCNISVCDSDEDVEVDATTSCFRGQGEGYRGTVNVTSAGVTCQRWDSLFPHNHSYTPHNYKCKDLRENFCRNPDGSEIPWCFTTDPKIRKAFCTNIPRCESENSDSTDCYEDNGESYHGNLSKTRSGFPCGLWSDHTFRRDIWSAAASASLELNLCRNPDRDKHGPWCFTSNSSIPWDYCRLERCKSMFSDDHQMSGRPKPSCFIHKATRIVGGMQVQRAEDGSWVVSIQKRNKHWCGGSLIREEWVLTDQQCFSTCVPDLSEYTVQVGLLHLNASASAQGLRIAHVVCGPEGSNLALLKLTTPAPLSEHVRTIQLPVAGCAVADGTFCLMYGWGDTKGTGDEGSLKMVGLPIVSNKKCSQSHKGILPMTETKICAGGKRDQGVCERDYGGPLVCQERESKVIVGVSINGRGCAVARRPAVFVNVAFYSEWIRKVFKYYSDMETSF
ncbi:hepatocyte growth factor a [Triplophysa rosa]|uniref:Hepatocyte growth factor n=1 Tax=Triplophysa rosa TaxID=992332 RepID=A0A9W7T6Z0_TRIRA|nr:hepatocyte growth factor a [Triplophysa rosa]KAI7791795.1 putative hepatocyte growth factor [Triplophysa rosa]